MSKLLDELKAELQRLEYQRSDELMRGLRGLALDTGWKIYGIEYAIRVVESWEKP